MTARTDAFLVISLGLALIYGVVAMMIHDWLAIPVAICAFVISYVILCLATGP